MRDWLWYLAVWVAVSLFVAGFVALGARGQHDHGALPAWLVNHPDFAVCCSQRDCEWLPMTPRPVSGGWLVTLAGRSYPPVAYGQTKVSQDGRFYACILPGAAQVRCLWAPPSGV